MSLVSIFDGIINAEKSTAVWFEAEYVKLHKSAPTVVAIADKVLPYASLLLQTVIGAEAGAPAAAVAGKILSKAQADLDVANALIYDTGPTLTAAGAINAIQSNLSGLLSATQISNPTSVATVTKTVNELGVLSAAITAVVSTPATTTSAASTI
jgi:hypothetical protein